MSGFSDTLWRDNDPEQKASSALLGFASHALLPLVLKLCLYCLGAAAHQPASLTQNSPRTALLQFLGPPGAALAPVRPPHAPAFWTAHLPSLLRGGPLHRSPDLESNYAAVSFLPYRSPPPLTSVQKPHWAVPPPHTRIFLIWLVLGLLTLGHCPPM